MIQKNIVKQPKSMVEVTVSVPWGDLQPYWDQTLQKMSADVELPGFRKGMAPVNMVEAQLGVKLQDEALKTAMPQFLIQALTGTDIVPIDYPKYDVLMFAKGNQLQFKATITNRPTVTVGNYKTIKAVRPAIKPVTTEEVEKVITDLFNRWKVRQPAGQTSAVSPQQLVTQNQNTPAGGSISFNGQNQQPAASAPAVSPVSDTPNDDFAKAMGATSIIDLKDKVRKDLEANVNYNNELDYEENILQEVEKITTVDIPEILIQDELNRMLVSLQRRVADMGLLLEDYLKGQNKTLDQLKTEWRPQADKNVRMELGLAEIARMENVNISEDELKAEIDKITDPRVKQQFDAQEPKLHLKHALRQTKTLDLLKKLVSN